MVCRWAMRRNRANLQPSEFAGFRAGGPHPDRPVGINAPAKCAGCRCRRRVYRGNRIGTRLAQAARRRSCDASLASRQPAVRRPRGECSAAARCRWIGVRGATGSSLVRRRFIGGGACSSAGCSRARTTRRDRADRAERGCGIAVRIGEIAACGGAADRGQGGGRAAVIAGPGASRLCPGQRLAWCRARPVIAAGSSAGGLRRSRIGPRFVASSTGDVGRGLAIAVADPGHATTSFRRRRRRAGSDANTRSSPRHGAGGAGCRARRPGSDADTGPDPACATNDV